MADVAFVAHDGARLSGSGVALGIQSKGTAVIHRADLQPLDNLELFGMSPLYTLESYRAMGRNAAGYALGRRVGPVPTELDNFARAKVIVRTTLLHARETRAVVPGAAPVELVLARARLWCDRFTADATSFFSLPRCSSALTALLAGCGAAATAAVAPARRPRTGPPATAGTRRRG